MNIQKWEYKLIPSNLIAIDIDIMQDKLNQLGNEGWELIAISSTGIYTFKRPLLSIAINSEELNNNASKVKDIISLYQ